MVNDYARRGFVDARALRLPVIVVRPGAPNAALTGAWSTVVRDPLKGHDVTIPVPMDVRLPVASYQSVVAGMHTLLNDVPSDALGHDRTLMLPSLSLSPADMYAAAVTLADANSLPIGRASARAQETATRIVSNMGERAGAARAEALGIACDASAEAIVRAYAEDYVLDGRHEEVAVLPDATGVGGVPSRVSKDE